jgi:tetratricopeptide (TPR) repeat protein
LLLLGLLQSNSGRHDQAAETYRELSKSPNFRTVYPLYLAHVGKSREAVAELERLNRENADDRSIRGLLVTAYVKQRRNAEAAQILAAALKRNPRDTDALVQRADLAVGAGNFKEAEQDLKTVLHLAPTTAEAHYLMARVHSEAGSTLQERQELNEALRLSPNLLIARMALSALLVRTNQLRDAIEVLEAAPPSQKTSADFITARNWAWIANGNKLEARKSLDANLPTLRTADLLYQDALLKISQKQYSSGRNSLQEILKTQPENIDALQLLASSHAAGTGIPKALETLRQYADSRPNSAPIKTLYAGWLSLAGKAGDARAAFSEARNLDRKYAPAAIALGQMDFAEGKLDDVRRDLAPVLESTPNHPGARLLLAMTEHRAGNRVAAIAHYRAVVDREPKNQRALNNLALAIVPDDLDQALKYAQAAVDVDPNDASAEDTLGWILYQKGSYANAAKYLKHAVSTQVNPTRQFHLGMTYVKLGETRQARELLNEALKQDPKLAITEAPLTR